MQKKVWILFWCSWSQAPAATELHFFFSIPALKYSTSTSKMEAGFLRAWRKGSHPFAKFLCYKIVPRESIVIETKMENNLPPFWFSASVAVAGFETGLPQNQRVVTLPHVKSGLSLRRVRVCLPSACGNVWGLHAVKAFRAKAMFNVEEKMAGWPHTPPRS